MGISNEDEVTKEPRKNSLSLSSWENDAERKPMSNKLKYITAAAIFYGNIGLGCTVNSYGPTATSMQNKYGVDDAEISKVFTFVTIGIMVGALSAGFIYNHVNRQLAVITIAILKALLMFLTPHCPTLTTFFISAGVVGFCVGSYDTAQFVWIMEMMQKDCPPYVQSQHFFFGLGTNVASLIMAPFLDKEKDGDDSTSTSLQNAYFNGSSVGVLEEKEEVDGSKLFIPYTIIGVMVSINVAIQILMFTFMRYHPPPPEVFPEPEEEISSATDKPKSGFKIGSWPLAKIRIVILCAAFYGAYQGMEMCTFQFFPKFGQNSDLHLSESESTYVLTGLTAAFSVGRAIAIVAVFKIAVRLILCGNFALVVIANVILVAWAKSSLGFLWASSILFGLGFSSMYASFAAYIERHLNFTNFIASLMILCGSGVGAIYPLIVGNSIENNVIVLSYTTFFSIGVCILAVACLSYKLLNAQRQV